MVQGQIEIARLFESNKLGLEYDLVWIDIVAASSILSNGTSRLQALKLKGGILSLLRF